MNSKTTAKRLPIMNRIVEANKANDGKAIERICMQLKGGIVRFHGVPLRMDYDDQRLFFKDADSTIDNDRFEELMKLADDCGELLGRGLE